MERCITCNVTFQEEELICPCCGTAQIPQHSRGELLQMAEKQRKGNPLGRLLVLVVLPLSAGLGVMGGLMHGHEMTNVTSLGLFGLALGFVIPTVLTFVAALWMTATRSRGYARMSHRVADWYSTPQASTASTRLSARHRKRPTETVQP